MRFDPRMAARIESHVTLLYEVADAAAVLRMAEKTPRLRLRATRAMLWEGTESGVYLEIVDRSGDLARFREALGERDPSYRPHVTLLHKDSVTSPAQIDAAWRELRALAPNTDFAVELVVVYEEADGRWREAGRAQFRS
jgi:2'-5' RNA ligase superfamily